MSALLWLHCIASHCIALHRIVSYHIVLYCIVCYCIVLYLQINQRLLVQWKRTILEQIGSIIIICFCIHALWFNKPVVPQNGLRFSGPLKRRLTGTRSPHGTAIGTKRNNDLWLTWRAVSLRPCDPFAAIDRPLILSALQSLSPCIE